MGVGGLLGNRHFALLLSGRLISSFGDSLRYIGLLWLVKSVTGSTAAMGIVFIWGLVPYLLFGLMAGVLVDRFNRKRIMIWTDILRALLSFSIPVLFRAGHAHLWPLCAISFAMSGLSTFFGPTMSASVPNVVAPEDLVSANSLTTIATQLSNVLGPAIGGLLVAAVGVVPVFIIDGLSFLVSAASIYAARIVSTVGSPGGGSTIRETLRSLATGIREGFAYIFGSALFASLFVLILLTNFVNAPVMVLIATLVDRWGSGAQGLGLIGSSVSLGTVLGAVAVPLLAARVRREALVPLALALQGLGCLGLALSRSLGSGLAAVCIMGVAGSIVNIPLVAWVQRIVPDEMRGRVFAAAEVGVTAAAPISMATATQLADSVGVGLLLGAISGLTMLSALALYRVLTGQLQLPAAPSGNA